MNVIFQPESLTNNRHLKNILGRIPYLAVAFSGGVDSSLLLKLARDTLGERCIAITVDAPYHFRQELADAIRLAKQLDVPHQIVPFAPESVAGLMDNPPDRCYLCKKNLLKACIAALPPGSWTLVDGSTADDQQSHRPGRRALTELNILSPLAEAGFTKQDIRALSHQLGLPTWDKPAQSCLMTRFPHNYPVTEQDLFRVERCETAIQLLGFKMVRVRSTGVLARLEFDQGELTRVELPPLRDQIINVCKQAGFELIEIDPAGYRCGSMD